MIRGKTIILKLKNQKGISIIEILVALTILSVLAGAIITLFSGGFMNLLNLGYRSEKAALASSEMDNLRALIDGIDDGLKEGDIRSFMEEKGFEEKETCSELEELNKPENGTRFFCLEEYNDYSVSGKIITFKVFSQNQKHSVTLTSFIRGEGD